MQIHLSSLFCVDRIQSLSFFSMIMQTDLAILLFQTKTMSDTGDKNAQLHLSDQDSAGDTVLVVKQIKGQVCSPISKKKWWLFAFFDIFTLNIPLTSFVFGFLPKDGRLSLCHSGRIIFLAWPCSNEHRDGSGTASCRSEVQLGSKSA